jgi:hypothetical protein
MTATPDPTAYTVTQFDIEDQRERHRVAEWDRQQVTRREQEKHERRKLRINVVMYVLITAVVATACVFLFHQWWLAVRGPSAKDTLNQEVQLACVNKGGTWTTIGDGSTSSTCVFLKETTP